jgi:hypothetical protein
VNDRVLSLLEAADWNDIIIKLTYHALMRTRRYLWKSGTAKDLPGGVTPADIASGAIVKVWNGKRKWDPDKYPDLLTHLKWVVDSEIGHLYSSTEHQKRIDTVKETGDTDSYLNEIDPKPSPETELICRENEALEKELKEKLVESVKGDEDLEILLMCFEDGIDKPQDIAVATDWDITKVYNIKRKLIRYADKIGNKKGK